MQTSHDELSTSKDRLSFSSVSGQPAQTFTMRAEHQHMETHVY